MAFSVVQHVNNTGTASSDGSGNTTALTWPGNTGVGNLLVCGLSFRNTATVTCSTTGWLQAVSATQGTRQTEIWYKPNSAGSDPAPVFIISASTKYTHALAEISGVKTTSPLDKTGTATGTTTATPTVATTITGSSEFCFGVAGNTDGSSSVTWTLPSTAGGGATFQADIDSRTASASDMGQVDSWAVSGSSGTSPSFTFTDSSAGSIVLVTAIATFFAAPATTTSTSSSSSSSSSTSISSSSSSSSSSTTIISDIHFRRPLRPRIFGPGIAR